LLLEHLDNFTVPDSADTIFSEIATEYDAFTNALENCFIITCRKEDKVSKPVIENYLPKACASLGQRL
jgi:hypothetical protein